MTMTNLGKPLCFVDTETTSLRDDRELWEIAMIRVDERGVQSAVMLVEVDNLPNADAKALQIGRFWERHPQGRAIVAGPTPFRDFADLWTAVAAAEQVASFTHGAELWGAVPSFDADGLTRLLRSNGLLPTWSHRVRCVETLVMGHTRREVNGLDQACARMKVDNTAPHTAMGDAQAAYDVYRKVMGA